MRYALLLGNADYRDPKLSTLKVTEADVKALAELLRHPDVGHFDQVKVCLNPSLREARIAVESLFARKKKDDLLLLYFSGHGILNENSTLYFAFSDTESDKLHATGMESSFIKTAMNLSFAKQHVLLLDCCFSGSFIDFNNLKGGPINAPILTKETFVAKGKGQCILTSSGKTQYSLVSDQVLNKSPYSLFTHFVVEGLKDGSADENHDGIITPAELHQYVYEHVIDVASNQEPALICSTQGPIELAYRPCHPVSLNLSEDLFVACLDDQHVTQSIDAFTQPPVKIADGDQKKPLVEEEVHLSTENQVDDPYLLRLVRKTLVSKFDDVELEALVLDYFSDVYDSFSYGMRKDQKVNLLVNDLRMSGRLNELANILQQQGHLNGNNV